MIQLLRAFSLAVTDRRWAAPMAATALGLGIFAGVAIGPSASGTLAGVPQLIEIVEPPEESAEPAEEEAEAFAEAGGGGPEAGGGASEAFPAAAPLVPEPAPRPAEAGPGPAPEPSPVEEPGQPQGTELKGTVVHVNPAAGSYALAIKGGELVPVHAKELPKAGARLTVEAHQLANGTFAEAGTPERTGHARRAAFAGTVTWAGQDVPGVSRLYRRLTPGTSSDAGAGSAPGVSSAYTVSGRGASLLVYVEPDESGAPAQLPEVGAYVKVAAAIEPTEAPEGTAAPEAVLRQRELTIEAGEPSTYLDLAGILGEVAPDGTQLLISADDTRTSESDLTLAIPPSIDPSRLTPGDSYLATAEVQADATLLLKGIASDEHRRGAEDPGSPQGDLERPSASASSAGGVGRGFPAG